MKILDKYRIEKRDTRDLIGRSFLIAEVKELYDSHYFDRLKMLNNSHSKKI